MLRCTAFLLHCLPHELQRVVDWATLLLHSSAYDCTISTPPLALLVTAVEDPYHLYHQLLPPSATYTHPTHTYSHTIHSTHAKAQ